MTWAGGSIAVRTARLRLRSTERSDWPRLHAIIARQQVAEMLASVPHPFPRPDFDAWMEAGEDEVAAARELNATILEQDRPVGLVSARGDASRPVLGYWLDPERWGRRYATEAVGAFLTHVLMDGHVRIVHSGAFTDNPRSLNLLASLGFAETGVSRVHCLARDAELDHVDMALVRG